MKMKNKEVKVYNLGKNNTILASSNGPVFKYEYKRTIGDGPCWSTFSNDLKKLEKLHRKEKIASLINLVVLFLFSTFVS